MRALGPALLSLLVLAGCGNAFAKVESKNPSKVADGLVFTRADGSSYEVNDTVARCTRSGVMGTEYVYVTEPAATGPGTRFFLRVALGVTGAQRLPLPTRTGALFDLRMFARDPATGRRLSAIGPARGEVTITEATCDPEPRLSFQIDASMANPAGRPVKVRGGLASLTGE